MVTVVFFTMEEQSIIAVLHLSNCLNMVIVRQEVRSRALCVIQILLSYVPGKMGFYIWTVSRGFVARRQHRSETFINKCLVLVCFAFMLEWTHSPIQHSSLAQGDVLTTSGGSTPTLRHNTSATLTVFIWRENRERSIILTSLIKA